MANTATRANKEKNTRTVTFKSEEHEKFCQKYQPWCRYQDEYHKALVYCLGIDNLMGKHRSRPYNPSIANTFFRAGFSEAWGHGIEKIKDNCKEAGNPMPEYTIKREDIMVMFKGLVSGTDQGTNQANQDDDNSVSVRILKVIQENPNTNAPSGGISNVSSSLESEVLSMCNLSKGVEERGIAIGIEREREAGTLRAIESLMDILKLTAEQAMAALKVPENEKAKYAGKLNK